MKLQSKTFIMLCIALGILVLLLSGAGNSIAQSDNQVEENPGVNPENPSPVIHPEQLEYWPLLYGSFDVQAFLVEINSPLKDMRVATGEGSQILFATALEVIGEQYNIHPRILLTLLEVSTGKVTGFGVHQSGLNLAALAPEQTDIQNTDEALLKQLEGAAKLLRENLDHRRKFAWQTGTEPHHSIVTSTLIDSLALPEGREESQASDVSLVELFETQFEGWFGSLAAAPLATTQEWNSLKTSLPYATGTYNSGPHTWSGSGNIRTLSGLDFGSTTNDEILNIANAWLVEFGCSDVGGNTVSVLIDGTDYVVSYWHLADFSAELKQKKPGDIIPLGFPIGTEGGTASKTTPNGQLSCYHSFPAHTHLELDRGTFNLSGGVQVDDTWDGKRLGPTWVFWSDTTAQSRLTAGDRPTINSGAYGYDGTAVKFGVSTEVKDKVNPDRPHLWSTVERDYPASNGNTVLDTPQPSLDSDNIRRTNCEPSPCPEPPLEILAPTANNVLQAGPFGSPVKNVRSIRVVVDKQFTTLAKDNFAVFIGGKTADIQGTTTLAGSYNTYELVINPPIQPSDGLYDLEVKVKGISAFSPKSIQYGEPVGVSYVVLLDTSTSMNCSLSASPTQGCTAPVANAKIYSARTTAEGFVRLLQPREFIGLVRFQGSGVNGNDGTPQLASTTRQEYLAGVLRNVIGDSATPLYDAIQVAVGKFAGSTSPAKFIVVLSDGADFGSQSSIDNAIQAAKQAGVQVCTVRFGTAAILAVLNRISTETGCTAAQSALDPGQLNQVFASIRTTTSGLQTINSYNAILQSGQTKEYTFNIDRLNEATFQLVWENPTAQASAQLNLKLTAPDGTQYTPNQHPGAEYISGSALSAFRVLNPLVGLWKLFVSDEMLTSVQASEMFNNDVAFEVSVTGNSNLKLNNYSDSVVTAGGLLELAANVANPEPILGATVLVTVERPSGSKVVVPLLDDGQHGDGFANDGYYSAAFYDTFQTGTYRLAYGVQGNLTDGAPFTRFARRAVEVQGNAGQGVKSFYLPEGLNLIGLDGIAPTARDPNTALLSIRDAYTVVLSYKYPDGGLGFFSDLPANINTLKEIDPFQGYWIRTTKAVTLQVAGPGLAQNHYIPVHPGWNLVPYLTSVTVPVIEALSSIDNQYLGVRGYRGGALSYWPQLPSSMNTLQGMEPGLGYWILMSDVHSILQYPAYVGGPPDSNQSSGALVEASVQQIDRASTNHPQIALDVTSTEQWVDLYSFDVTVNGQPAPAGTVIAVHDPRGRKVGAAVVQTPGWVGVLSVYGDSGFTEGIDGALSGDGLTFTINNELATATNVAGNTVQWTTDGDLQQIRLSATINMTSDRIFLPLISR